MHEIHLVNDRIEDVLAPHDLQLRISQFGIGIAVLIMERVELLRFAAQFQSHGRLVFPRLEIGRHGGTDDDQQKCQDDDAEAHPDDPPVVEEVKL